MIRLLVNGALGRMGMRIRQLAAQDERFKLVAAIDSDGAVEGADAIENGAFDLIIDFSSEAGTRRAIELATQHQSAVLVGTTGLSDDVHKLIDNASSVIAVMLAANTSPGIAIMRHLAARGAQLLGDTYEIALVDVHHSQKKDAPSGTALRLVEAVESGGRKIKKENVLSARIGDIVGEHTLRFAGPGEYLELTHRATTRDLFVVGALRAGAWLAAQQAAGEPGRYTIDQALGLSES